MPDQHKNFAYSTVLTAPSPATSGTSLVVQSGDGAKFPTVPFNATICPATGIPTTTTAEIVRVTTISTDTFTITRAQESSSARTVIVGDQIAATITAKTLTDVETLGLERDYVENTSSVAIVSTTEGTPTTVITGSNLTVAGETLIVSFGCRGVSSPSNAIGDFAILNLHLSTNGGSTFADQGRLAVVQTPAANTLVAPMYAQRRTAPSAGTAQYRVVGWVNTTTGVPTVQSGVGGAGTGLPIYLRVTQVA